MTGLLDTILTDLTKAVAGVNFVSRTGRDLIRHFEGENLSAYKDVAGIWTIGVGHTGPDVVPGRVITQPESDRIFIYDLQRFEQDVLKLVKVRIHQHQFDALVSFAFNCGSDIDADILPEGLGDSTLLRLLNERAMDAAADEFLKWNKATVNGKKVAVPGLTKRRKAERELFLGRDWRTVT